MLVALSFWSSTRSQTIVLYTASKHCLEKQSTNSFGLQWRSVDRIYSVHSIFKSSRGEFSSLNPCPALVPHHSSPPGELDSRRAGIQQSNRHPFLIKGAREFWSGWIRARPQVNGPARGPNPISHPLLGTATRTETIFGLHRPGALRWDIHISKFIDTLNYSQHANVLICK